MKVEVYGQNEPGEDKVILKLYDTGDVAIVATDCLGNVVSDGWLVDLYNGGMMFPHSVINDRLPFQFDGRHRIQMDD
jgi:hypothetical protein